MKLTEQPEIKNFGKEKKANGYVDGYNRSTWDRRKRLSLREKNHRKKFGEWWDYLSDEIFDNKKK